MVRQQAQIALAIAVAVTLIFGVQGIASALPAIQHELGIGDSELALLTAAYVLPGVVLAVPLGYAADTLGRRRVFLAMTLLFGAAGVAQAFAGDVTTLLVLRFLQGVGFASLMPMTVALIGDAVTGLAQLRAQAHRQLAVQLSELAVPLAGAALAALAWNAPFYAQALMLALAPLGLVLDPRLGRSRRAGGGRYARALGTAVLQPGIPPLLAAGFLRFWCKFALLSYLPVLLVHDRGASLLAAAAVVSVASLFAALVSPWVARLVRHLPPSRLAVGSAALLGAGLVGLGLAPSWQAALAPAVVFGLGDGVLSVLQNSLVVAAAPQRLRAGVLSAASTARNSGKLAAPLAMGAAMLAVPTAGVFVAMGAVACAGALGLRRLAVLDGALAPRPDGAGAASGHDGDRARDAAGPSAALDGAAACD